MTPTNDTCRLCRRDKRLLTPSVDEPINPQRFAADKVIKQSSTYSFVDAVNITKWNKQAKLLKKSFLFKWILPLLRSTLSVWPLCFVPTLLPYRWSCTKHAGQENRQSNSVSGARKHVTPDSICIVIVLLGIHNVRGALGSPVPLNNSIDSRPVAIADTKLAWIEVNTNVAALVFTPRKAKCGFISSGVVK